MRFVIAFALLGLTACGSSEPPPPDTRPEILKNLPDPLPCAKGAENKMGQTEKGLEQWCEQGGKMNGPYIVWHLTGKKATEGVYRFNDPDGSWTWWYESGRYKSKVTYRSGKLDGDWTRFHENGKPAEKATYRSGLKNGLWTEYYDDGSKKIEGYYRNDQKDGEWQWWDEDGELTLYEKWDNGSQLL